MKAAIVKIPEAVPEYGEFVDPTLEEGLELADLVAAGLHPSSARSPMGATMAAPAPGR